MGVIIGVLGVWLTWYVAVTSNIADPDQCEFIEYVILSEYNTIYDWNGELNERAIVSVKYYADSWKVDGCIKYNMEMASIIKDILDHIETLS